MLVAVVAAATTAAVTVELLVPDDARVGVRNFLINVYNALVY